MKDTIAKESKNGRVPSPNMNTSIIGGNQETKKKERKSVEVDLEGAVKTSNVECSDEKERKKKKKTTSKHLIDADDGSAAQEKETLTKNKPVEPEDCTANQEATERKLKKKRLKKQLEDVKEVEQDEQSGDRKRNKKDKKRKYEASFVTEVSGENFTEVMQKKKCDEEASDEICVKKKKKKAKAAFAKQVETDALEGDLYEDDKVTKVKKVKKSKRGETQNLEEVEIEDEKMKKKKKVKSKKNETVEEEVVSEKKVKKGKSKRASVEVTEVEKEVAVKKMKKKKDGALTRAEKEEPTGDCEEEQSEETDTVRKKKKKKATKNPEGAEQKECDSGAKKRKKNQEKGDQEQKPTQVDVVLLSAKCGATDEVTINQERRQALQNDVDQWSQAATFTKHQGLGQWSTAQFDSTDQQQKFLRLMGGFKKGSQPACRSPGKANMALGKAAQQQLQQGLLGQFEQAHSRRIDFGSRGAGLGFTAPSNKKFTIDVNASRSVRFDD